MIQSFQKEFTILMLENDDMINQNLEFMILSCNLFFFFFFVVKRIDET